MSDQWAAGGADGVGEGEVDLGRPITEGGVPGSLAFRVDNVLKNGVAVLSEQPLLVLLGALNLWVVGMLPGLVGGMLGVGAGFAEAAGNLPPELAELIPQMVQLVMQLALFPVQQVVLAGMMVGVGSYVVGGDAEISRLYLSFGPAMRALLYSLLAGILGLFLFMLVFAPSAALGIFGAMQLQNDGGGLAWALLGGAAFLFVAAWVPLVYVSLGLQLGTYAAVLDGLGPGEALARSWQAADGSRLMLFLTNLSFAVVSGVLGCLCCGIPAIPVSAILFGGMTSGWLLTSRSPEQVRSWSFFTRNPPPTA